MVRFLARRIFGAIVTLFVTSFVVFAALYVAPGNPLSLLTGGRSLPPETLKSIEAQYHLDDPFLQRYWTWLTDALHGNFGGSLQFRQDVWSLLEPRVGITVTLLAYAALLMVIFGVGLGIIASLRKGAPDTMILAATSVLVATPVFVTSIALVYVFGVELGWFPTSGAGVGFADRLWHLTLPAIALALSSMAYVARLTRSAMNAELEKEHVEMARGRGIPERLVIRRHVVRNAMIPITTVTGISIAALIAADVVVEFAFGIGGVGSYLITAVTGKDFAVVQAIMLLMVASFIVINTLVDITYALLDPRIDLEGSRP
jgi:peptide/nickel transport system permease protein